jgi:polysaccharide export outer membrane protein
MSRAWRSVFFAFMVLGIASCQSGPAPTKPNEFIKGALAEYKLGPGDKLKIAVFDEPDLTGEFVITSTGTIAYPLVGEIPAQDMTVQEFSAALQAILRKGYVKQPKVTTEVMNYRPFFILGEVNSPGTFPYSANLTVMNAVATAGGFTFRADTRRVYIKRVSEVSEQQYPLTSATVVEPGDTVRIPERRF